jgi:hypothetical protein
MAVGNLNPLDNARSVASRPATVLTGDNERRWFSEELDTILKPQDLNAILGHIRHVMDFYSIADVEGSDTGLRQAIQAGAASLSGNLLRFQSLTGAADKVPYFTSASGMALFTATSYSRGLLSLTNQFQWADALGISATSSANVIAFSALASAADTIGYFTGSGSMALTGLSAFIRTLLDDSSASAARTTLGLGSAATHPDTDFAVSVSPALTGVPTAPTAGPGTNTTQLATTAFVQAAIPTFSAVAVSGSASDLTSGTLPSARLPASLSSVYGLTPTADRISYYTGTSAAALATLTAFARTILDDVNDVAVRNTLGLSDVAETGSAVDLIGTLGSARLPASLASIYPLTPAADRLPYYTSASAAALATLTAFARTLLDDIDASAVRTTLGLVAVASSGSAADLASGTLLAARLPASLSSIYALTPAADRLPYYTSSSAAALTNLTGYARTLLDDADAPSARATLGVPDLSGDSFTGSISVDGSISAVGGSLIVDRTGDAAPAILILNRDVSKSNRVAGQTAGLLRWQALFGDGTNETGSNSGSDFSLSRYDDSGTLISSVFNITRSTGIVDFTSSPTAPTPGGTDSSAKIATTAFVADNFAALSGPMFSGPVEVNTVGAGVAASYYLSSSVGFNRNIFWRTGTSLRWQLSADSTAEGGSNAGSNFSLSSYNDSGALLGTVFSITRSSRIAAFSVSPTAPTPSAGDSTTKLATTGFVAASFAPLASPALTGTPTAPTAAGNTNTTQIATTAFVASNFAKLTGGAGATFTGFITTTDNIVTTGGFVHVNTVGGGGKASLILSADALNQRIAFFRTGVLNRWTVMADTTAEGGANAGSNFNITAYADDGTTIGTVFAITRSTRILAFSVSPTAPTPSAGDSTTKLATTGFVAASFAPIDSPTFTGVATLPDGTVSAPSLAIGAANDGIYQIASGTLGFAFGGVQGFRANANGIGIGIDPTSTDTINIQKTGSGNVAHITVAGEAGVSLATQRYSGDGVGSNIVLYKARGTIASPAAVTQNATLGSVVWEGHTGTDFVISASLRVDTVASPPSPTDMESRVICMAVPPGSVSNTELWRFDHATGFSMFGANPVINQNRHFRPRQYAAASLPAQNSGDMIASSDVVAATLVSDGTEWLSPGVRRLRAVTANTTVSIPAGWSISQIMFANTTANAVTGGVRIGTTSGATDVVGAQAIGANAIDTISDANILKKVFSRSAAQTLFIQAVTSWNGASVEFAIVLRKVY